MTKEKRIEAALKYMNEKMVIQEERHYNEILFSWFWGNGKPVMGYDNETKILWFHKLKMDRFFAYFAFEEDEYSTIIKFWVMSAVKLYDLKKSYYSIRLVGLAL